MASAETIAILNRLVTIHRCSLASYMKFVRPWSGESNGHILETLAAITDDHDQTAHRIASFVLEQGGILATGDFPMEFPGYHDVSLSFLLDQLIARQVSDMDAIKTCVEDLHMTPMAKALAEEALGESKAHLELLEELKQPVG